MPDTKDVQVARGLGWTTLLIALTEIAFTKPLQKWLGIDDHETLIRSMGARELLAGIGILSQKTVTPALAASMWSRVGGDAIDLALLGVALKKSDRPASVVAATALVVGITALDVVYACKIQADLSEPEKTMHKFYTAPPALVGIGRDG